MSRSYFKLKILSAQRNKKNISSKPLSGPSVLSSPSYSNLEKLYRKHQNTKCRICLKEGIIPIYGGDQLAIDLPDAIQTIGGVEVRRDDAYPKHLCEDCHALLKGAVVFRKSAQESDEILRQTIADTPLKVNQETMECLDTPILSEDDTGDYLETGGKFIRNKQRYTTKMHKNVRIQCRICMKLLTRKLYKKHLTIHESTSHLVCDVCGKLFRKDNLPRHLQLHSKELPFQCQVCPYRGRFMGYLKVHMRSHSDVKLFPCDKCEQRFNFKSNLNKHLLTHSKLKPYKCLECSRAFYTQRDLEVHIKADHAGIKQYSCRQCGNKYGTKKNLLRHELKVHKRDKMPKGSVPLYLRPEFQNGTE